MTSGEGGARARVGDTSVFVAGFLAAIRRPRPFSSTLRSQVVMKKQPTRFPTWKPVPARKSYEAHVSGQSIRKEAGSCPTTQ